MTAKTICPRCGSERLANSPEGHCPRCLLRLGSAAEVLGNLAPGCAWECIVAAKPDQQLQAEVKVEWLDAGSRLSGILATLDDAVGPVPRVLLRDGACCDERPVRPHSDEMVHLTSDAGRYHLLGEIARGGMGVVLKGRDEDLGRDLAVKVLLEKHRGNPELVRRFVEEAQIGGQLQHPGIVPVYELGQLPDERLFIAMKLLRGRTLAALLEARKDPAEDRPRFLQIFEHVCQTMAYAHSCGVIHRDLKPSNVMVGNFGEVQVMDWGLAKVLDEGGVADEAGALRSTDRGFSDPHVADGLRRWRIARGLGAGHARVHGARAGSGRPRYRGRARDVFGLGSILCEILTGQPVYTDSSGIDLPKMAERGDVADALARLDGCGADGELVALARSMPGGGGEGSTARCRGDRDGSVGIPGGRSGAAQDCRGGAGAGRGAAIEERKRRVLAIGLAVAVLLIAALVGGGWSWVARDRAARAEETNRVVNEALHCCRAQAGPTRGPTRATPCCGSRRTRPRAEQGQSCRAGQCTPDLCERVRLAAGDGHPRAQRGRLEEKRPAHDRASRGDSQ